MDRELDNVFEAMLHLRSDIEFVSECVDMAIKTHKNPSIQTALKEIDVAMEECVRLLARYSVDVNTIREASFEEEGTSDQSVRK